MSAGGLEGVVVADTRLSDVDGEQGRLIVAGYEIEALTGIATFEDVCSLLWDGKLPGAADCERLRAALGAARVRAFARIGSLGDALEATDGMDALRGCIAQLPSGEEDPVSLTAAVGVFAAAWGRQHAGRALVAPDASAGHAADVLRMIRGDAAPAACASGLEAYLVTVVDHGMNASTFTARVVASTGSDAVSAVTAAIGALKGPLHGGAPGPVLDMLDAIGVPERASEWLSERLAAGQRIMGMGHRIYRVRDPRALVLEKAVERLESAGIHSGRLALARAVEHAAEGVLKARHPDRPLHANVEFYTAVLLDTVGVPRELFSSMFAASRVVGWCAHVAEQRATGRLIRPGARYVGPRP
jgi:citrate synthase